jgi:ParB/RepB/Spo0J family partition protein
MTEAVEIREPELIDVALCDVVDWNPNSETEPMFAALVEKIRQEGFKHPIDVVPDGAGRYRVIAGEHRVEAARVLGMGQVPAYVEEVSAEDEQQIRSIRDNVVRGKVDPVKFTRLYDKLAHKYGPDALRRMMGLSEESAFRALHKNAVRHLPPEIRKRLQASQQEIATVDDLGKALQKIMAEFGNSVPVSFVVFSFGGREHLLVRTDKRAWDNVRRIADESREAGVDVNVRMNQLLEQYLPFPGDGEA